MKPSSRPKAQETRLLRALASPAEPWTTRTLKLKCALDDAIEEIAKALRVPVSHVVEMYLRRGVVSAFAARARDEAWPAASADARVSRRIRGRLPKRSAPTG